MPELEAKDAPTAKETVPKEEAVLDTSDPVNPKSIEVSEEKEKETKETIRERTKKRREDTVSKVRQILSDESTPTPEKKDEAKEEIPEKIESKVPPVKEKKAKEIETDSALPEELVNRAKELGFQESQLKSFDSESLDFLLTKIEMKTKPKTTETPETPVTPVKLDSKESVPTKPEVEMKSDGKENDFESLRDLEVDEYDETLVIHDRSIREAIRSQNEKMKALEEKLERYDSQKTQHAQNEILQALDSADEAYKAFIDINDAGFRERLMETVDILDHIDSRNSKPKSSNKDVIQRSLAYMFPEAKSKIQEKKVIDQLQERKRALTPKKDHKTTTASSMPFQERAAQKLLEDFPDRFLRSG